MRIRTDLLELGRAIAQTSRLEGNFVFRSGDATRHYFDKYQCLCRPKLLTALAREMAVLAPGDAEVLAGLELGGVAIAAAVSLGLDRPMVLVRKNRHEYGTRRVIEGVDISNRHVCLVDDIVTSGEQLIQSAEVLRAAGAQVTDALAVICRHRRARTRLSRHGIRLRTLFTPAGLDKAIQALRT